METKSRYEVVSELEEKKRTLIKQRDELDFETKTKERALLNLKREKEDQAKIRKDYDMKEQLKLNQLKHEQEQQRSREKEELNAVGRARDDWEFRMQNSNDVLVRRIVDAEEDIKNFQASIAKRKDTITEQIKSIDEALERSIKLQKKE